MQSGFILRCCYDRDSVKCCCISGKGYKISSYTRAADQCTACDGHAVVHRKRALQGDRLPCQIDDSSLRNCSFKCCLICNLSSYIPLLSAVRFLRGYFQSCALRRLCSCQFCSCQFCFRYFHSGSRYRAGNPCICYCLCRSRCFIIRRRLSKSNNG